MEKYKYRPLIQERNEIRLVRFIDNQDAQLGAPGLEQQFTSKLSLSDDGSPIYGTIEHHQLDDMHKQYTALSYTWGSETKPRKLIVKEKSCEDRVLPITENLYTALRHMSFSVPVWIDSVCINQADDDEKSWQVQRMWDIFEKAALASAWLGPSADESDRLMDQIRDSYITAAQECSKLPPSDRTAALRAWRPSSGHEFISLAAFTKLLQRPYWQRVWIQQELHAPNVVFFHCGTKEASLPAFHFILSKLAEMATDLRGKQVSIVPRDSFEAQLGYFLKHNHTASVRDIAGRHIAGRKREVTFTNLIRQIYVHSAGLHATDERDLMFALLGMAADQKALADTGLATVNYGLTKEQIYFCFALELISRNGPEALTWCNGNGKPTKDDKLPSWAPDWSKPVLWPLGDFGARKESRFNASNGSKAEFRIEQGRDPDFPCPYIIVTGVTVDKIACVGRAMEYEQPNVFDDSLDDNYALQSNWLTDLEQLSKECHSSVHYPTLSALQEALWKTAIADQVTLGQRGIARSTPDMDEGYKLVRKTHVRATMKAAKFYGMTAAEKKEYQLAARYWRCLIFRSSGRRYFRSEGGLLGLGPDGAREGDVLVIIHGMDTLMVLRREERKVEGGVKEAWRIAGESYVHGAMNGELAGSSNAREFWIC